MKHLSGILILLVSGCTTGFRDLHIRDRRLDTLVYLGSHWASTDPRTPHFFGDARLGSLNDDRVKSRKVPGGRDEWAGLLFELEAGHAWPIFSSDSGALVGGVGVQGSLYSFREHLSGPGGKHSHSEGGEFHRDHLRWGTGLVGRLGYVQTLGGKETLTIEPNLGVGLTAIDEIGSGWFLEGGIHVSW